MNTSMTTTMSPASSNLWFMLVPLLIGVLDSRPPAGFLRACHQRLQHQLAPGQSRFARRSSLKPIPKNATYWIGSNDSITSATFRSSSVKRHRSSALFISTNCWAKINSSSADLWSRAAPRMASLSAWRWTGQGHPRWSRIFWVLVKGTVQSITLNDQVVPLIQAESVQAVPVPEQPYLFP